MPKKAGLSATLELAILAREEKGRSIQPLTSILESDRRIHMFLDDLGDSYSRSLEHKLAQATGSITRQHEHSAQAFKTRIRELERRSEVEQVKRIESQAVVEQNKHLKRDQLYLLERLAAQREVVRKHRLEIAELKQSEQFYREKCKTLLRAQCSSESSEIFPTLPTQVVRSIPRVMGRRNRSLVLKNY